MTPSERAQRWQRANPERLRAIRKRYYENLKKRKGTTYDPERRARFRNAAIAALGSVCKGCGISDSRVLDVDHVHENGEAHRVRVGVSETYYNDILRGAATGEYQLLCLNCHEIKNAESGRPRGRHRKEA